MKTAILAVAKFLAGIISEDNGTPSASRSLMFILAGVASTIMIRIFWTITRPGIADSTLALWLTSLPSLIATLTAFIGAAYMVNRGTASISDILASVFAKKDNQPRP